MWDVLPLVVCVRASLMDAAPVWRVNRIHDWVCVTHGCMHFWILDQMEIYFFLTHDPMIFDVAIDKP